jgi:hypothetical protein
MGTKEYGLKLVWLGKHWEIGEGMKSDVERREWAATSPTLLCSGLEHSQLAGVPSRC